jgi:hypothetical protein
MVGVSQAHYDVEASACKSLSVSRKNSEMRSLLVILLSAALAVTCYAQNAEPSPSVSPAASPTIGSSATTTVSQGIDSLRILV